MKISNPIVLGASVALSGFGVYLFDKLFGAHIDWDHLRDVTLVGWIAINVPLVYVAAFVALVFAIYKAV
ncbi:MAG TPA: hypothetical protein VHI13_00040 [Candidatus Kapabacteria bacterium]|nr:hypothetical protein [Candidatus Kapabacteria bacterium]